MQLRDVKSVDDMKRLAGVYGVMSEQIADNLQDLKHLVAKKQDIDIYSELLDELSEAQRSLYQASIKLSEIEDD